MRAHYHNYRTPHDDSPEEVLSRLLHPSQGMIAVDTETISLSDTTCIGIGIAPNPYEAYYIPVLPEPSEILPQVMNLLADKSLTKLYHNAVFDLNTLRTLAVDDKFPHPDVDNIEDTTLMAKVMGKVAGLEELGTNLLGLDYLFSIQDMLQEAREDLKKKNVNMLDVSDERVAEKCSNDITTTWRLYDYLNDNLSERERDCYNHDRRLLSNLQNIQQRGLRLNPERLESHRQRLQRQVTYFRRECDKLGFNPGSPQQVGYILSLRKNVMPFNRSGKGLRTDEETLMELKDPVAHMVLAFRGFQKLLSGYITPWSEVERAYTHFRLDLTTGRLASFKRNMQNIPPELRDIFTPDNGIFTWADLSQMEMRLFAAFSQDKRMLQVFAEGGNIHKSTAQLWPNLVYKEAYRRSKTFNFAMIFDGSVKEISKKAKIPQPVTEQYRQEWFELYPEGQQWIEEQKHGTEPYAETMFGRKMLIPTVDFLVENRGKSPYSAKSHIESCRVNYPIQGTAADKIKRDMNYCEDIGIGDNIRLQVHDEILWDGDIEFPMELENTIPNVFTPYDVIKGKEWTK